MDPRACLNGYRKSRLQPGIRSPELPERSESVFGIAVISILYVFTPLFVRTALSPFYSFCELMPT